MYTLLPPSSCDGGREEEVHFFISSDELRKHFVATDLWISIQGKVYDYTGWLKDHPGGDLPLRNLAGQDVTDAFVAYQPGSAWKHLDRFLIGHLSDYQLSDVSKDYRRLLAEVSKMGLFEKKGCALVRLLCGGMMGFLWIQSGWMGHDSGHYKIVENAKVNRFIWS